MNKEEKRIIVSRFNSVYESYKDKIFSFCMAKSKCNVEMAEDCTQEAFIVLFKRMKKGEDFKNPQAFLYKTANNFLLKAIEKKAKKINCETSLDDDEVKEKEQNRFNLDEEINYQQLTKIIENILNDDEKQLFKLKFVDDLKVADIAKEINCNEATCATKLHRLRNKLKKQLTDYIEKGESNGFN